jgi:nitrite reductase (NO-forming)
MRSARRPIALLGALSIVIAACASGQAPTWTYPPAGTAAPGAPAATPGPVGGEIAGSLDVVALDLAFEPGNMAVDAPGRYEVNLRNDGAILHDITFPDGTMIVAAAGETASATIDVLEGGLTFFCSIPGHADAGMRGQLAVGGAAENPDDHGGPAPATDVEADPDAPPYELFPAAAPARLDGEVHDVELVIEEKLMTVADGFVQAVWTFGGTVPGPVIRVKVGDTIRVHLLNPATNRVPHSVDFHASQVAWNDEMTSINPGEEKIYEWTADYAGVWMYHCGTAPALHHIANGMFGMVIVEPREGLPAVDHEAALVQSEWYLGPQGEPASLAKASEAAPGPDFVVFNGIANQYLDHPIAVATGERVRLYVLNAGPSVDSSFHIVGTIFDTVIREGVILARGNPGNWGAQAVDLSPAQGAIIEFTTAEDGLYPIVTHAFNLVGRGALGLVQAGDGDPLN